MRSKSYQEVNREIESFNNKLAEATFHGQIEVFYVEKFENQSALYKELSNEYNSRLFDLRSLKQIFSEADFEDEDNSIDELCSRKNKLDRNFDTLIKGRVIRIFHCSDGRRQIGDELSFKLEANFGSFIPIGGDPVWEYEALQNSKFMELLLKEATPVGKFIIKRLPAFIINIDEISNTPLTKEIVFEDNVELELPEFFVNMNKAVANAGLHFQVEIIERIRSVNNLDRIKAHVIQIFVRDEMIQIGDEVNFAAKSEFSQSDSASDSEAGDENSDEKKYVEVIFHKNPTVKKEVSPTVTSIIKEPTEQPNLLKKNLLHEPLRIDPIPKVSERRQCPSCSAPLMDFAKFCVRCGLAVG